MGLWMFPLVAVPLSFWLVFAVLPTHGQGRLVLWTRLWFASLIGLNAAMMPIFGTIDYHDSRNSGSANDIFIGALFGTWCCSARCPNPASAFLKETARMRSSRRRRGRVHPGGRA
ncbi:MAG: hypothetical protein K0Q76_2599 [Panacagrimonas sp.]|nr:hypothetical protein [Panacagrimonas sp.]